MSTNTVYDCQSITEKKIDSVVVAYLVTDSGGTLIEIPLIKVHGYETMLKNDKGEIIKKMNGRLAGTGCKALARDCIQDIVKSGSTVTSITQEHFCDDNTDLDKTVYTTDSE